MKKILLLTAFIWLFLLPCCNQKKSIPPQRVISALNLKKGQVIACGPSDMQLGSLAFETSCGENVKEEFNLAIKLLHSFEYDEAEKVFARVIEREPRCAMAWWGVAMSNFHPLWAPPAVAELEKGAKAIQIAQSLATTQREVDYIDALASFYTGWEKKNHRTRTLEFEAGMEKVSSRYPADKEATIFYALALNAAADPKDQTFRRQRKAGELLKSLYPGEPDHPGLVHYLIHTYDYPELALQALPAARKYASIAPSSAHALHMPSHIFTRLGLWDECIHSNLASVASARCYAEAAGIKGHWDEELHGLDYLVYAYLQKGENDSAKKHWDYVTTIKEVHPVNFKVAYAFAAIPSRYLLENRRWEEAARLAVTPARFPWKNFPWQEAIIHFTRLLGSVHTGNLPAANGELKELHRLHDTLLHRKASYEAGQVDIQLKTAEAWIRLKEGRQKEALTLMQLAAEREDQIEKHPVTPGEVIPARELLGDMLLQMNRPGKALEAFEASLQKHPNRLNALKGARLAAEKSGNRQKAESYSRQLASLLGEVPPDKL